MASFEPVDPKVSFPEMEARILAFWSEADVFAKSLRLREAGPEWVFYEGPPTANGRPGIHHVEARTFKDIYPRFKTMTGHFVPRKGGWDCHGLPVELEVEKQIGTSGKRDIEEFGIAEFNRLCRESVTRYVGDWERLTERIGFWIDMSDAYWTMSTPYIESVWWALKQLHGKGLLFEADKVTAYCPRCETALSDAEVALGYERVEDPSLYVELRVLDAPAEPSLEGASIAVWTTTPWTLLANIGLAVAADAAYAEITVGGERLLIAEPLRERVFGDVPADRMLAGTQLVGARYAAPYDNVEDGNTHRVVAANFVSMDDGTGVVHIAPAFGPEDLELGRAEGWPVYRPVDGRGRFTDEVPEFLRGRFVKEADADIVRDLERRGLVIRAETIEHSYPLCWRCRTPLLYYARTSWYVGTTARKDRLLQVNESVNWYPDHIKRGRYGDWLENNVDWALSRERYWGTPLPVWRCGGGHATVVGSLSELSTLTGRDVSGIDPHRPAIDDVVLRCPTCGDDARRVTEVIDTWFDSGAMPYAQWAYHPELGRGLDRFRERFPADFISEAIDQTRGWFYTLMAESVLLFDDTSYRNVVCLGHLVAGDGRKMSKSLGNVVDPWDALDRTGADALRWLMITSGSPWASRRVSMELLDEIVRQFLLTLWNVYAFFVTYANAEGFDPAGRAPIPVAERPLLDRWVLSQLATTNREARIELEAYDATSAGRRIQRFVDDLSNWYVRRSRRRFWNPEGGGGEDSVAAFQTLHESLVTVATLLAPFTPFVAEELWRNLEAGRAGAPESVHLADYPEPDSVAIDERLDEAMRAARGIVALGRTIRTEARIRVRQPLAEAVVHYRGDHDALVPLLGLVREELNVREIVFTESTEGLAGWRAKPNYRALGPRLGPRVKELATALASDDGTLAARLAAGAPIELSTPSGEITLTPDDVDLAQEVREGWGVRAEGGLTVALELELTQELRREGIARELVRVVQDARRAAGLDVADRITLGIRADGEVAAALDAHHEYVAAETLAVALDRGDPTDAGYRVDAEIEGEPVRVGLRRTG
jgi:isoleucyl-tRNA synthetase